MNPEPVSDPGPDSKWHSPQEATTRNTLLLQIALTAVTYYFGAQLGFLLTVPGTNIGLVWPPAGIMLAFMLLFGYRIWPGIVAGNLAANLSFMFPLYPAPMAILMASGACLGSLLPVILGTYWVESAGGVFVLLNRTENVLRFALFRLDGTKTGLNSKSAGGEAMTEFRDSGWTEIAGRRRVQVERERLWKCQHRTVKEDI